MSLTRSTEVVCDGPRCMERVHGHVGPDRYGSKARASAKAQGWTRRDGLDLCQRCAKKVSRKK